MKFLMAILSAFILSTSMASDVQVSMTLEEAAAWNQLKQQGTNLSGASIGGVGQSCMGSLANTVSNGMQNNFQAQTEEANMLMNFAKQYYELEQKCGNDLAQVLMEHNNAVAEYETKTMQLPNEIENLQIEYELAVLAVQQECEQTSGEIFQKWKLAESQKVVEGVGQLVNRQQNINKFQKLFYDDCLASESNAKRVNLLARKLDNNVKKLQTGIEASAKMLKTHSQNMSFKQGVISETCDTGRRSIDYQRALAQSNANAAKTMAQTNNFFGAIGAINQCMSGPSGRQGIGNPEATNNAY